MALVIEDGTIIAGANSFVTRAEIIDYAALRGVVIEDDEASDVFAIQAMDYLWSLCFKGDMVDPAQTTPFPRSGLIDGDDVDGYVYTIPAGIKNAQLQLALDAKSGIILTASANTPGEVKRTKVGPIEREFFQSVSATFDNAPPLTLATSWLAAFVCDGGAFSLKTYRV